jgi:hypothetical protein
MSWRASSGVQSISTFTFMSPPGRISISGLSAAESTFASAAQLILIAHVKPKTALEYICLCPFLTFAKEPKQGDSVGH